jgi:hypothetical protein
MSYRTFKRVLGETNLERKCRWWFGISLFVMLGLSFTLYGSQTYKLVEDSIQTLSNELVRAGWQKKHIEKLAEIEMKQLSQGANEDSVGLYEDLADSSKDLARAFEWEALLPPSAGERKPIPKDNLAADDFERSLFAKWPAKRPPHKSISISSRCTPTRNASSVTK